MNTLPQITLHAFALIVLLALLSAEPHLPLGIKALPSAAPKGRGPLALVNLNHHVLGHEGYPASFKRTAGMP